MHGETLKNHNSCLGEDKISMFTTQLCSFGFRRKMKNRITWDRTIRWLQCDRWSLRL